MFELLAAPAFGTKHLLGLLYVIIFVVVGLQLLSKQYSKKKVLFITILFYVLEILKLGYFIVRDSSYPMSHLPFHLCSMPLYIWPILYFTKEDSKLENYALATAFVTIIGGGVIALLMPENIIGSNESWFPFKGNYLPFISFNYHALMILSSVYLLYTGKYKPKYSDSLKSMTFTLALMIIALIADFTLDKDFMLLHHGKGSPLKPILDNYGQLPYTLSMITVGLVVIGLISAIATTIYKLQKRGN